MTKSSTRERFESYLPKYGALWRSMANKIPTSPVECRSIVTASIVSSLSDSSTTVTSSSSSSSRNSSSSSSSSTVAVDLSHLISEVSRHGEDDLSKEDSVVVVVESEESEVRRENDDDRSGSSSSSSTVAVDLSHLISEVSRHGEDDLSKEESVVVVVESEESEVESEESEVEWMESPVRREDDDGSEEEDDEHTCSDGTNSFFVDDDDSIEVYSGNDDEYNDDESSDDDDGENKEEESCCSTEEEEEEVSPIKQKSKPQMTPAAFHRQCTKLTSTYFTEFNHKVFDQKLTDVPVTWSKTLRTTAGITILKQNKQTKVRIAEIELSLKVIDDIHKLRSTLLHEMCHAAAWLIDGVSKPPHGKCFKKWAGVCGKRVKDVVVTTRHDYFIRYKYAWACSKCNSVIQRHSRSVDVTRHSCARCNGKFIEIEVPSEADHTKSKTTQQQQFFTPKAKKEPTGFSLFIQQHSKTVREKLMKEQMNGGDKVKQTDVMKECSRLWKLKVNKGLDDLVRNLESSQLL